MNEFLGPPLTRDTRVAIFWGGGLGDMLVLRPLLLGLQATLASPPALFTTATHLPNLLSDLGLSVDLHVLPRTLRTALPMLRQERHVYDLLYLGPYPTLPTRLLAKAVRSAAVWQTRHVDAPSFVGEQVLADVKALRLNGPAGIHQAYGGAWRHPGVAAVDTGAYLVLHPGAKGGWQTKQWPSAGWTALMDILLENAPVGLRLVGVEAERPLLEGLLAGLSAEQRSRISIQVNQSLQELAGCIAHSAGVICHNSGVMHLSAMLATPTLALTGASPTWWRPPYAHVNNITSGRCKLACNQYRCPVPFYRARCIRELRTDDVYAAARELFAAVSWRRA